MEYISDVLAPYEENTRSSEASYGCGLHTIRRLICLLQLIFSRRICLTFALLICALSLLEQYVVYQVGMIPSGFYKVLGDKNLIEFWSQTIKSLIIILAISFIVSCKKYVINVFYVMSREILTEKVQFLYFKCNKFYYLNTFKYSSTDNPDQRITQDIEKFSFQFSAIISPFIVAPFIISYYSYSCFVTTTWIGPVGIFLVFICSVIINRLLIKPIMNMVIKQEKYEGFFRFKHMHVRCNAESIAFQDASSAELSRSEFHMLNLIQTQQTLYLKQFPLDIAVNIFNYLGSIISYLILAAPIFSGKYSDLSISELGALISMNAFVSIYLISSFSSLVDLSTAFGQIGGLTHRVYEILEQLKIKNFEQNKEVNNLRHTMRDRKLIDGVAVELKNANICTPNDTSVLIFNLSLKLKIKVNILVTGNSGTGKTSLFRVIKGLWPLESGSIIYNLPFKTPYTFFLPQRPLLSDGTLLEQIVYPLEFPDYLTPNQDEVERLKSFLKVVKLDHIVNKAGIHRKVEWKWEDMLSPGEAQRLSFVRLFYHKPTMAFLDEATSAIDLGMEQKLYEKCKELDITVISIGHRTSLLDYHDFNLHLDGQSNWTLQPISH